MTHRGPDRGAAGPREAPAASDCPAPGKAIQRPAHWAVTPEGLSIYRGGELVIVIPASQFGELLYQIASVGR